MNKILDRIINIDLDNIESYKVHNCIGIYFLYKDDELVYIGQSKNIGLRIYDGHVRGKAKDFDSYKFVEISDDYNINKIERLLIEKYLPTYNKSFNVLYNNVVKRNCIKDDACVDFFTLERLSMS